MVRYCPRCAVAMKLEDRLEVEVDKCPKCKGIYFDADELDKLSGGKALEGSIFTARVLGKELKCPSCGADMHYVTVQGVTIDQCSKCEGIWLDDGEMKKLRLSAPEKQFDEKNAPYEVQKEEKGNKFLKSIKNLFHKEE